MLTRRCSVLIKKETSYGVDATPAASDGVLCRDVEIKPVGDELQRDFLRKSLSPLPHQIGERHYELRFTTELKGSGTAGTAPELSPCFQACGFAETIVAVTSVTYAPESDTFPSATIYVYRDGILHKLTGARGTFEINLTAGKFGEITWTFQGIYNAVTDVAMVDGTYDATLPPVVVSAAFSVGGYAAVATKLALNMANQLALRRSLNEATAVKELLITGWPDRGGSFDPEAVLEATHPFFANWLSATQAAMTIAVGATGGNICTITAPKVQYRQINPGDRDGLYVYEIPIRLAKSVDAGDDEISIAFT